MNFAGKTIVQKSVAILIIMVMTLADITLVGANVISYAVDMVATNSDNVEFSAYFINENNEKVTDMESEINAENLKMQVEIAIKNEGYFNGEVLLENTGFKFKGESSSEYINKIEDKKVTLNTIKAGDTAVIDLGISFDDSNEFELSTLNGESEVKIRGTYVNSKKDSEIKGTTKLHIDWKSPKDTKAKLETKVLTNSLYKVNETNKRIVQVLINSKLNNNSYPVKNTNIELNVPAGVEEVKVHSRSTSATNGNADFNENNYNYNQETGMLTINITNEENEGKIKWNKNSTDVLVVTYIYSENANLLNTDINVNSIITTYDNKELKAESTQRLSEDIDGIVTNKITEKESSIYKGKIYTGEKREYISMTTVNIDYAEAIENIKILENQPVFEANDEIKSANIQYIQTKIKKSEFDKILGEDGNLNIIDQDGNIVANINKDSNTDDNGYIVVKYNDGVKSITIESSKPITNGILNIEETKVILNNKFTRDEIKKLTAIEENVKTKYEKIDKTNNTNMSQNKITLKDTSSVANIKINKQKLSTITNNNVELVATLEANDESKDLYKNPKVRIIFPKEIEDIRITQATALYRNGLTLPKYSKTVNKDGSIVINLDFSGEQKKYNSKILNGLEIHFFANVKVNKSTPSKDVKIQMNYTNENGNEDSYNVYTQVHLESQYGLMLYNKLQNYNSKNDIVETIDENKAEAKLDRNSKNVKPTVTTTVINNYNKDIKNVEVIGDIPSENDSNTFNASLSNLKVNSNAKVLYNTKVNAKSNDKNWTENSKNAKSYKVIIDEIKAGKFVKLSYNLDLDNNLSYNETGSLTTNVIANYGNGTTNKISNIEFLTEKSTVNIQSTGVTEEIIEGLQMNISAVSGNKELKDGDSVYSGETIKYTIKFTNNTGKNYEGITVKATQTNGKLLDWVEKEVYNNSEENNGIGIEHFLQETDSSEKQFDNINIPNGKTVTLEAYQVVTNKDNGEETYGNIQISSADGTINKNITTIKNNVKDAKLKMIFTPINSSEFKWESDFFQLTKLNITNLTDEDLNNVEVKIVVSDNLSFKNEQYNDISNYITLSDNIEINSTEVDNNVLTLKINTLTAKTTGSLYISPWVLSNYGVDKFNVELYANATTQEQEVYTSNNMVREVIQAGKGIGVTQTVKINNENATKDSVANNGDTVDFYITIKNNEKEKVNFYIFKDMNVCLDVKNVTLVNSDKTTSDITDKILNYCELNLDSNEEIGIIIKTQVNTSLMENSETVTNYFRIKDKDSGVLYSYSTELNVNVVKEDDENLNITAIQEGKYTDGSTVKDGDEVEYTIKVSNTGDFDRTISIYDYINNSLMNTKVLMNNKDITEKYLDDYDLQIENYNIKAKTDLNIKIKGTVGLSSYKEDEITNELIVKSPLGDAQSNTITYYVDRQNNSNEQGDSNGESNNGENNGGQSKPQIQNYTIKGKAWIDSNEDGKRDDNEKAFKDITVRAINTQTEEVLSNTVTTGEDGSYEMNLPEGKYIIAFLYNDEDYLVTTYQAKNVNEDVNSDVVSKQLNIDNQNMTVGATDVIDLSSNKENIDIGLIFRNKFDFKLSKSVTKMVVTNDNGTETYDFDDSELAKIEIHSKYLSGSTVLVEYKIKVTNVGDIAGHVNSIVDYMPKDMTFNSNLNKDWYKSGNYLYNESISDTTLDAGESTEVKLILTKKMTDSNTGLVNNSAAIQSSYNSKSFSDVNSDNNNSSADVIISVKTGAAIRLALLTLSLVIVIAVIAYFTMRNYINKKI